MSSSEDPPEKTSSGQFVTSLHAENTGTVLIGGIAEAEYRRRQKMPRRALSPADIPGLEWREMFADLVLREDGAVMGTSSELEVGWLDGKGGINWVRC